MSRTKYPLEICQMIEPCVMEWCGVCLRVEKKQNWQLKIELPVRRFLVAGAGLEPATFGL